MLATIFKTEIRKPSVDLCRRNLLGVEAGGKKQNDESQFAELIEARFSSSLFLVHNLSFSSPCAVSIGSPASCRSIFRWCNCRTRTNYRTGSSAALGKKHPSTAWCNSANPTGGNPRGRLCLP